MGGWNDVSTTTVGLSLSVVKPITSFVGVGVMAEIGTSASGCEDCVEYKFNELSEGDRIFVRGPRGELLIYKVYINTSIEAADYETYLDIVDSDPHSLTLITCEDERQEGGYANRRIIAAKPIS